MSEPDAGARGRQDAPNGRFWWLNYFEEAVAGAALIIIVLAACWGVFTRYVTQQPATWTVEVATIAFAWSVFVGGAAVFKHAEHMSVDLLVAMLPVRLQSIMNLFADGLVLIFCVVSAGLGLMLSIDAWDNPTSVLRIPLSTQYASVAVGFIMMAWRLVQSRLAGGRRATTAKDSL